jgi:Spy/CpxP family protein refolding chaperone
MIMKSLIAAALVALSLLSVAAAAADTASDLPGYPEWAQHAFEPKG